VQSGKKEGEKNFLQVKLALSNLRIEQFIPTCSDELTSPLFYMIFYNIV
jgi:hypothetical protein